MGSTGLPHAADIHEQKANGCYGSTAPIADGIELAILTTISVTATNEQLPEAASVLQQGRDPAMFIKAGEALTCGYTSAFAAGAFVLLAAAVIAMVTVSTGRKQSAAKAVV